MGQNKSQRCIRPGTRRVRPHGWLVAVKSHLPGLQFCFPPRFHPDDVVHCRGCPSNLEDRHLVRLRQGCAGHGDIRIFFQFWFTLGSGNEGESTTRMYVEGRCSCSKKSLPSDVILNLVRSSLRFDGWSVTNTSLSIRYVISMICRLPSVWIV